MSESPIALLLKMEPGGTDLTWMGPPRAAYVAARCGISCAGSMKKSEGRWKILEMSCVASCGALCKSPTPVD